MATPAKPNRPRGRADAWDEQLVLIDGQRLKALIDASEKWTIPTLSEEMCKRGMNGASRQTIDYICRERNQTCRAPLRKELAKEFGMPEEWLSGEMKRLPSARPRKVMSLTGLDEAELKGRTIAEAMKAGAKLEIIDYPADLEHPPAYQIARHRFMAAVSKRATRDVKRLERQIDGAKSEAAYKEAWNGVHREDRHNQLALATLDMATSPAIWQALVDGHHDIDADEYAEAAIALTKAFTVILGPWMRGETDLDREILRDVNELLARLANVAMEKALAAQRERFGRDRRLK